MTRIGEVVLNQHGELKVAKNDDDFLIREQVTAGKIENLMSEISDRRFCGLAMTEIPEDVLKSELGLLEPKRFVWLGNGDSLAKLFGDKQSLLIYSPESIPYGMHRSLFFPKFQGCGSIDGGKLVYLTPEHIRCRVNGWIFIGDNNGQYVNVSITNMSRTALDHEINHLNGRTHISSPQNILDIFRHKPTIEWVLSIYNETTIDELRNIDKDVNWLVYNRVTNKLEVLDKSGLVLNDDYHPPKRTDLL